MNCEEYPISAEAKRSIEGLPPAAKDRTKIGHLEFDALQGICGGAALQVVDDYFNNVPMKVRAFRSPAGSRARRGVAEGGDG